MKVMIEKDGFFADTYALIEMIGGNKDYEAYLDKPIVTTKMNLAELYYHFLKDYNEETARKYLRFFSKYVIPVSYKSLMYAMKFKLKNKSDKLSYTDCIGYALASENSIRFLTGDIKFKDRKGVEWVR